MLSKTQVQQFHEQGYLVLNDVISTQQLQAVEAEYTALMDTLYQTWFTAGWVSTPPQGLSFWDKLDQCHQAGFDWYQPFDISLPHENICEDTPMHFGPAIFDIVTSDAIVSRVAALIGSEITSNPIQHVRIKPPEHALPKDEIRAHITSTDWHQDRGVGHEEADHSTIITVWVAITDATVDNGCLQVIPGVHQSLLPHCPKRQTTIADGYIDTDKAVTVPVKAGGIVILHPLTPHSSLSNTTTGYRWSFDLRYNVTGHHTGRAHFPAFVVRSQANPERELHDWQVWKQRWEEARTQVANKPHIPQHRWSPDSPACA